MIPPPTPTYAPTLSPSQIPIHVDFTLWDAAPHAISYWHWAQAAGVALQVVILIVLVYIGTKMLVGFLQEMTRKDSEE